MKQACILKKRLPAKLKDDQGQGLTEYLILIILISVISITTARTLGTTIRGKIELARRHIEKELHVDK